MTLFSKKGSGKLRLTFAGGAEVVTGSNFLLETTDKEKPFKILIDCGLFQGCESCFRDNYEKFPYDPSEVDVLLVTHAHIDHIGRIPKLVKEGFRGIIYSTEETKALAELLLPDSARLLAKEAVTTGFQPLYTEEDIGAALRLWKTFDYHQPLDLGSGVTATMYNSGHILGSAIIAIDYSGIRVAFTGDLGNSPSILLPDFEKINDANYLVIESTYGNKVHDPKPERTEKLLAAVTDTIKRKGTLLIPAFSLERTQTILYELDSFVEEGLIEPIPVFVDSPLSIAITKVYEGATRRFNDAVQNQVKAGDDVFSFSKLHLTKWSEESRKIHEYKSPKIILASAGMSTGGRVVTHQEFYLGDPNAMILFIGYQAAATLGRRIQEGAKKVTIGGRSIDVRAEIRTVTGYSGHADSLGLLSFVEATAPTLTQVFVAMGEPSQATALAQRIHDNFGVDAIVARPNHSVDLS